MLKKLRLKFIIVNMSIVTIMLGVIFGLLYYSTSRNLERESMQMMGTISMNPIKMVPSDMNFADVRLPYFNVMINHAGEIIETTGGFFDLSDDEFVNELIKLANYTHTKSGVINDYNLRFLRIETPMGESIVFADITSEQATLRNLVRTFLIIGSAAFLGFLAISIILAYWAVKPVENAWKQQKQFIADASHELKTPLTVIMTDAELLSSEGCTQQERYQLSESIGAISEQMRGLVERMLELARVDYGEVDDKAQTVDLSDVASTSAMMFEPIFFEKEMTFVYDIADDIKVNGNESQLKQAIDILLDNAGKYASAKGKTILSLRRSTIKHCLISVSNQGDPIGEEDINNLFKRFYRADKARSLNHSYGLGLSIAQTIIEKHHGKIWAESKDGYNTFYIELTTV